MKAPETPRRILAAAVVLAACGQGETTSHPSSPPPDHGDGGGGTSTAPPDGATPRECLPATGTGAPDTAIWKDPPHRARVTLADRDTCARTYTLSTTAPLRDGIPANPRTFTERPDRPVVRTGNDLLDALHALAVEESIENSVAAISDGGFAGGAPHPCPPGGCFETGRLWKYVWTRDTSYAVALGLGVLDPTRARNSLELKVSPRRDGTRPEIVQDTGTGGSWPISTDRVVWAMGAFQLLGVLSGSERTAFRDLAYEAIVNTAERDRKVVWDPTDGLYRGEQSFLDWREQSYAGWTATDTVHVGMSKALGTNVAHAVLLDVAARLATEVGDHAAARRYADWADALRSAVRARLWLPDRKAFSSFLPTELDPAPVLRHDLLGSALAVIFDAASPEQAEEVVARYPHLPRGAPVLWPQQQDTPIYHNRALWPFVTAFWAKAAARVGNADAVDLAVRSLVGAAALNLTHIESLEAATGAAWVAEGPTSGPVVSSQRQLWSVAGFLGTVHEVLFGLETGPEGIRFAPRITRGLRRTLLAGADAITLSRLAFQGKRVRVRVNLPEVPAPNGMLDVRAVRLDGREVGSRFVAAAELGDDSVFEVDLGPGTPSRRGITRLDEGEVADYRNVFGPRTPVLGEPVVEGARLRVAWTVAESPADVTFNVYRDGRRIAEGLPGSTSSHVDPGSADHATTTHCYTVEAVFRASGNASQHARPVCHWGAGYARVRSFGAHDFVATGGVPAQHQGRSFLHDWGAAGDTITVAGVTVARTGRHLLQVVAGNHAGDPSTGITCAVKAVEVWDGGTRVGHGYLRMPHLAAGDAFRDSSFVPVDLVAGRTYRVVIREDEVSGNMSDLAHFARWGGAGGVGGRWNRVDIAELKVLAGYEPHAAAVTAPASVSSPRGTRS